MRKRTGKQGPEDVNEIAFRVIQELVNDDKPNITVAKAQIGQCGGLKGGNARAAKLTCEQRSEIARKAARIRWAAAPQ